LAHERPQTAFSPWPVLPLRYQSETTHKNKTAMFGKNIAVKFIETSKPKA